MIYAAMNDNIGWHGDKRPLLAAFGSPVYCTLHSVAAGAVRPSAREPSRGSHRRMEGKYIVTCRPQLSPAHVIGSCHWEAGALDCVVAR